RCPHGGRGDRHSHRGVREPVAVPEPFHHPVRVAASGTSDRMSQQPGAQERGSMTTELAITVPAFLALLALVIFGGWVSFADEGVQSAADEAARAASIARDAGTARAAAQSAAYSTLEEEGL